MSDKKFVFMTEQSYKALVDIIKQYYTKYHSLNDYLSDNKISIDNYKVAEYEDRMIIDLQHMWEEMLGEPETSL
jgi:hypothetical protein